MFIHGEYVKGAIDQEGRCIHYQTEVDRVLIQFYCCKRFFPCFQCHQQSNCRQMIVWPKEHFHRQAIMCGSCGHKESIISYLACGHHCSHCQRPFNLGCRKHRSIYFAE